MDSPEEFVRSIFEKHFSTDPESKELFDLLMSYEGN